ncbi:glycosyl transferase [Sulfitobacter sp. SK012]|uniref:glycosyltransferase family 2 protein n=1 Tax=Sulfitobacter sp. SK012 TaxID=1389005 RepID=UPI000E0BEE4E|nr:glycosyltransferase family 2 protein [Sulfitobacter sp. SK012]AXI45922.1 glycosyl transferase [Sulfitobacter sp. SK012]
MHTRLLVVLLNFRTPDMTLRAAEAALADMDQQGAELVIVDNASGDGSFDKLTSAVLARGWTVGNRVRVIASPVNGGFGAGNNVGIRAGMSDGAPADFVYILNSDAFPDPGCIGTLLSHMQAHPKVGIAGSHVRGEDGVDHCTAFRFPSIVGEFEGSARLGVFSRLFAGSVVPMGVPQVATRLDWTAGASMMLRGEMLERIGAFDETFFLYFEETDLCLRAARDGWECWYLPQSRVVHIGSVSTGMKTWERMPRYWFDSRRYYFVKNHGRAYAAAALLAHLTGGALHRLRALLGRRHPQDPPRFLGDLLAHAVTSRVPVSEDRT